MSWRCQGNISSGDTSFFDGSALAARTSTLLRETWESIIGSPVTEVQWSLACFPIRMGGLGVTDPLVMHPFAVVSSFLSALENCIDTGTSLDRVPADIVSNISVLVQNSPGLGVSLQNVLLSGEDTISSLLGSRLLKDWCSQSAWTEEATARRLASWDADVSDRFARLRQFFSGAHAGTWLSTIPSSLLGQQFFSATEVQALLKWQLSIPISGPDACAAYGAQSDSFGDHALCCSASGVYKRHNCVRDLVISSLSSCGVRVLSEVCLPGSEE